MEDDYFSSSSMSNSSYTGQEMWLTRIVERENCKTTIVSKLFELSR